MSSSKSLSPRQRYWLAHLQACAQGGLSLAAYASAQGLKVGALYEAKSRLRKLGAWPPSGPRFEVDGHARTCEARVCGAGDRTPARASAVVAGTALRSEGGAGGY